MNDFLGSEKAVIVTGEMFVRVSGVSFKMPDGQVVAISKVPEDGIRGVFYIPNSQQSLCLFIDRDGHIYMGVRNQYTVDFLIRGENGYENNSSPFTSIFPVVSQGEPVGVSKEYAGLLGIILQGRSKNPWFSAARHTPSEGRGV